MSGIVIACQWRDNIVKHCFLSISVAKVANVYRLTNTFSIFVLAYLGNGRVLRGFGHCPHTKTTTRYFPFHSNFYTDTNGEVVGEPLPVRPILIPAEVALPYSVHSQDIATF